MKFDTNGVQVLVHLVWVSKTWYIKAGTCSGHYGNGILWYFWSVCKSIIKSSALVSNLDLRQDSFMANFYQVMSHTEPRHDAYKFRECTHTSILVPRVANVTRSVPQFNVNIILYNEYNHIQWILGSDSKNYISFSRSSHFSGLDPQMFFKF